MSDKYLGNPIIMRRNRNSSSLALIDKVKYRIFSWQTRFLSQAGRSNLIKSVATTIPVYNMFVLLLPPKTTDTMDKMFRKFFCSASSESKKIHTIRGKRISTFPPLP